MKSQTVLRFAPSPTGDPHVGNVRTAIFAWLYARKRGGAFIVRVEDTDQRRKTEGAVQTMLESLRWIGLDWDEGPDVGGPSAPYVQSERLDIYRAEIDRLIAAGRAYPCYCPPDRLEAIRREQQVRGDEVIGYDGHCRDMPASRRAALDARGARPAVRFRMSQDGVSALDDVVFGRLEFENRLYDDFIALKSDGFPTYHLASVIDDHLMGVTHVARGKEWMPSVPRHLSLYAALGWDAPAFAHLPVILAPDRSKLSKRHGAASVMEYRDMGVLPEALMNYLALLGWSLDGETEIFSPDELIAAFDLARVSRSDAVFDFDKLMWLNGQHARRVSDDRLAAALGQFWRDNPPPEFAAAARARRLANENFWTSSLPAYAASRARRRANEDFWTSDRSNLAAPHPDVISKIVPLVRNRLKTLRDAAPLVKFLFAESVPVDPAALIQRGMDAPSTARALRAAAERLENLDPFDAQSIESELRRLAPELGIKVGQLLGTLRVAATAQKVSPPIFESLEALGRARALKSVQDAAAALDNRL